MARFVNVNWRWVGIGMNTLDRDTFAGEIISHFLTATAAAAAAGPFFSYG